MDLTLHCNGRIYLFEFKVVERAGEGTALRQLIERGYAEKHQSSGEPMSLISAEFSEDTRNITAFESSQG